ncbi:D-alanyl-D-alanine carboxypeptidase/D-alanyl-D-alanine endopeptidase [Parahaliea maris]|uniref:D-alanyl-D-alanine carboxypeptidase/D-alanyl-D-alanine endopeptidase n=1 Tax=Parahaliea maris TaxID=2716870 RepID=UPI001BB3AD8A|nr:D-alanyl-D-alanine carboxypeptidase/D-alanyl-D-alanine-endopeptidase [Parahaliea maris]
MASLLWITATASAAPADPSPWAREIRDYAANSLDNADALSVAAVPLNGPGEPQFVNADTLMVPGSIMKVVTTFAALELLGPNYTWDTDVLTDGQLEGSTLKGNLYLRFGGDPKLTIERLWTSLGELHGMGIDTIEGNLVLDGSYFQLTPEQPVFDDKGGNPYAPFLVQPSPFLTNLNLQQFHLLADERGLRSWATPHLDSVRIDNRVIMTAPGRCPGRDALEWEPIFQDNGQVVLRISGKLPKDCRTSNYLSLLPPQQYAFELVRGLLAERGITVKGSNQLAATPEDSRRLVRTTSPDLATMVRDINKWSSNVMARQMLLSIGAEFRSDSDDRASGVRGVRNWLTKKGIDTTGLVIENGAGLSRDGRMTARQGVQLLQEAWQSPYAADLMASMPIIALDGTMARRLRNTGLVGEGRIKTGSLDNVRSIAGFTRDEHGTTWAVLAIVNNKPAWNGRAVLDRVLYTLYFRPPQGTPVSQLEQ